MKPFSHVNLLCPGCSWTPGITGDQLFNVRHKCKPDVKYDAKITKLTCTVQRSAISFSCEAYYIAFGSIKGKSVSIAPAVSLAESVHNPRHSQH